MVLKRIASLETTPDNAAASLNPHTGQRAEATTTHEKSRTTHGANDEDETRDCQVLTLTFWSWANIHFLHDAAHAPANVSPRHVLSLGVLWSFRRRGSRLLLL